MPQIYNQIPQNNHSFCLVLDFTPSTKIKHITNITILLNITPLSLAIIARYVWYPANKHITANIAFFVFLLNIYFTFFQNGYINLLFSFLQLGQMYFWNISPFNVYTSPSFIISDPHLHFILYLLEISHFKINSHFAFFANTIFFE